MTAEELEQLKQQLLHQKSELQELDKISKESKGPVELDQAKVGRLSRMDAMQSQQMALEESRRRQQKLLKVEGALRRIESGEYGECFFLWRGNKCSPAFFRPHKYPMCGMR